MADRLSFEEGLKLFKDAPLEQLQEMAQAIRNEKNPANRVTFVLDTNPNYTNVCNADCSFCAFYRHASAKDAYTRTPDQVMEHMAFAQKAGLTTVLLQGGLNDDLGIEYYEQLVRRSRAEFPHMNPHFFTAPEIWNVAKVSGITVREVFERLWAAGQRTFPGGGAEILSERVRLQVSPKKMAPDAWIDIHKTAHEVGFRSTATMMYGHVEEPEDIVIHLDVLRKAQDKIPGFTAFIPWSYKRDRTALRRTVKHWAGTDSYYRILAFSRVYLDNFDHVQATWFSEGRETGMKALHYGADDFGGTIIEENVHRATNYIAKTDHQGMLDMIRGAGFEPAQRNPLYEILRTYEAGETVDVPEEQRVKEGDKLSVLENVALV